ncbi:MAG TPA: HNH endonuclease signature motif containing protein [Actinomycetota bacterium]|nr:HNH endonuclease signature motif containing protein [Actinomycetota bacterium]
MCSKLSQLEGYPDEVRAARCGEEDPGSASGHPPGGDARDKSCRFSRCGRPASWCDVHHIRHWADGGETSLANCVLLCRRHHQLVHEDGFSVEMTDQGPLFRRADGSVIEDNRAPP